MSYGKCVIVYVWSCGDRVVKPIKTALSLFVVLNISASSSVATVPEVGDA